MSSNSLVQYSTSNFSVEKIDLIKRTIADGSSDDELSLFIYQCQRTGLDPFARQIYSIQRQVYDPKVNRKVSKMTVQVSIDGLRLIAERTGLYAGQLGPYWCGPDNIWSDVWSSKDYPIASKVGVIKKGFVEPLFSVALWSEYAPYYENKLSSMWQKFPTLMIAKCAEALSLRRAFPQEMSGLYTSEEIITVPSDDPPTESRPYPPEIFVSKLAEYATKIKPAKPDQLVKCHDYIHTHFKDNKELIPKFFKFVLGVSDINNASLRGVAALYSWLYPPDLKSVDLMLLELKMIEDLISPEFLPNIVED